MSGDEQVKKGWLRKLLGEVREIFSGIFQVYRAWWVDILLLSLIIFIPLGVLDAADSEALESLRSGESAKAVVLSVGAFLIIATATLGEVFLAGAIGLSLIHAKDGRPPSLAFIARHLSYGRLIAVDILYVVLVAAGFVLFLVPGLLAFVYLALAGPVVEIEDRGIRASFKRSIQLVRGNFWLVLIVLLPIELVGSSIGKAAEIPIEALLGHNFVAVGLAEAMTDVVLSPLWAIAAVLLTRKMVERKDGVTLPGPAVADLQSGKPSA